MQQNRKNAKVGEYFCKALYKRGRPEIRGGQRLEEEARD